MSEITFYVPIKSVNLAHYFIKGCICPSRYLENRNGDIQDRFENYILLSKSKFTNETNCCLEVVLDNTIELTKGLNQDFFLLGKPIPVSRVKKIYFNSDSQKVTTVFNVNSGAAFLPDQILDVSTDDPIDTVLLQHCKYDPSSIDWQDKIELFDRLMGGFAVMSLAGDYPQNYPTNYFAALGLLNTLISEQLKSQSVIATSSYEWAILGTGEYAALRNAIYAKITNDVLEDFARKEKVKLERANGKIILERINPKTNTYLVAILASYGDTARMKIDTFISDFISNKLSNRKEGLGLIFGLNKGYNALRNQYKTQNFVANVKFKFDSQLDYYTVESIYQFAFNNNRLNNYFEYIDSWCIHQQSVKPHGNYETYHILDKAIILKKKEEIQYLDSYQMLFQSISRDKIYERVALELIKYLPPFVNYDKKDAIRFVAELLEFELKVYTESLHNAFVTTNNKQSADSQTKESIIDIENLKSLVERQRKEILTLTEKLNTINDHDVQTFELNYLRREFQSELPSGNVNLFSNADSLNTADVQVINGKKMQLSNLGITKLKEIAKGLKIGTLSKYNNNPTDKEKLIGAIILAESKIK